MLRVARVKLLPAPVIPPALFHAETTQMLLQIGTPGHAAPSIRDATLPRVNLQERPHSAAGRAPARGPRLAVRPVAQQRLHLGATPPALTAAALARTIAMDRLDRVNNDCVRRRDMRNVSAGVTAG